MSLKSGEGKSLKGIKGVSYGSSIDTQALVAALSVSGLVYNNVTLQNVMIWSGMMDDVAIGTMLPSTGIFTKVAVGIDQGGAGGDFTIYGDKGSTFQYDDNGNVVSSTPGDQVSWDPATALFDILGSLSVRDASRLGNIVIEGNKISAFAPLDGNVELYPQSSNGYITIGGNVAQNLPGSVQFNQATTFSIDSPVGTSTLNSKGDSLLSTERGDITLLTDSKSHVDISSIVHQVVTTARTVSTSDATGVVTETDITQTITGDSLLQQTETTMENGTTMLVKVIEKNKTVVDGQPAVTTTTEITSITPATPLQPEQTTTFTTSTTLPITADNENDFQPLQGDTVTDVQHMAIVQTVGRHGVFAGDVVQLHDTNSVPSYDGEWTVSSADENNQFILPASDYFASSSQGYVTTPRNGSINVSAARQVRFEIGVPVVFGTDDLLYRPALEATTQDEFSITAHYVHLYDPIPSLHSPGPGDSGVAIEYAVDGTVVQNAFLGLTQSTNHLTWIPSATVNREIDGTKTVSGERGTMELKGIQVETITGSPNLVISASQGGITFDSTQPVDFPFIGFGSAGTIGPAGPTGIAGNSLSISSPLGNISFSAPSGKIEIPVGTSLTFSDTASITGSNNGDLNVSASSGNIDLQSNVMIGSTILSAATDGLNVSGSDKVTLAVNDSVVVPEDVFLQIGNLGPRTTGFVGHQGTLATSSVADMSFFSGGNLSVACQGALSLTASAGVTHLNSSHVYLPALAELDFGPSDTYISTMPAGTLTVHGEGLLVLSSPQLNLSAGTSINVPDEVPVSFGTNGAQIMSEPDGPLHITNPNGIIIDKDLVVSGSFTVYGPVSEITSTTTVLEDPIMTLGNSAVPEYVKDRGIQFYYGEGKLGFMGFGQDNERFYLIQNGNNQNQVFDKTGFGDLQVNRLYADVVSSTSGFLSSTLSGNPFLDLNGTYIQLLATEYVFVPETIPLQFGSAANSIYEKDAALNLDSAAVNVVQGHLNIGAAAAGGAVLFLGPTVSLSVQGKTANLSGADTINLEGVLSVPTSLSIGQGNLSADGSGNLVISANGGNGGDIFFQNQVEFSHSGTVLGNSRTYWDDASGTLVVSTTDLSLQTNVRDARWMGQVVETAFGGTGRQDNWSEKSVVFVGSGGSSLVQDAGNFLYDVESASLALRSNAFQDALTIGNGNVDFMDDAASVIFRTAGARSWKVGKDSNGGSGGSGNRFSVTSIQTDGTEKPVLLFNSFGQMAFGGDSAVQSRFFSLTGQETDVQFLFGPGDVSFLQPSSCVRWTDSTYVTSNSSGELVFSGSGNALVLGVNGILQTSAGKMQTSSVSDTTVNTGADFVLSATGHANVNVGGKLQLSSAQDASIYSNQGNVFLQGNNVTVQGGNGTGNGNVFIGGYAENLTAASSISLEAPTVSLVASGTLNFTVDGNETMNATGDMTFSSSRGNVTLVTVGPGDLILESGRGIATTTAGNCVLQIGGDFSLDAVQSVSATATSLSATVSKDLNLVATDLNMTASNAVWTISGSAQTTATDYTLQASNSMYATTDKLTLDVSNTANVVANSFGIRSTKDFSLSAANGTMELGSCSVHCTSAMTVASDDTLALSVANACTVQTGTLLSLTGTTGITLNGGSNVSISSGTSGMVLQSAGSIETTAVGDVSVVSQNGDVVVNSNSSNVRLTANKDLDISAGADSHWNATGNIVLRSSLDTMLTSTNYVCNATGNLTLSSSSGAATLSSSSTVVDVSSPSRIRLLAPQVFTYSALVLAEDTTTITATLGGLLNLSSSDKVQLSSPHVLVDQRLCWHHDASDACTTYATFSQDATATTSHLDIVNSIGDIRIVPFSQIWIPDDIKVQLGSSGWIQGSSNQVAISSVADISLQPGSGSVDLPANSAINFGDATRLVQTETTDGFLVSGSTPVSFRVPSVFLPDRSPLVFGDDSRQIVSDGDALFISSKDLLSLESATVRIVGNLVVSKTSTFTIETETSFDSGIITLGGGETRTITDMVPDATTSGETVVTVSQDHQLRPGDMVTLLDTHPDIDGTYVIDQVPTSTQFTIGVLFPGISTGDTAISGTVRSQLTENPGTDEGIQFNWHTGTTPDTSGARTGFFGFNRSTQRFVYIPEATRVNDVFQGTVGDMELNTLYAENISAANLVSPMDAGSNAVVGSNFRIAGGSIDNVSIGTTVPSVGTFTYVTITDGLAVGNGGVVKNLNADLLDNYHASAFVFRDGSNTLTGDWYAGAFRITATGFSDVTLSAGGIVTVGEGGNLETFPDMTYADGVFNVSKMGGFQLVGNVDINSCVLSNGTLSSGTIRSSQFSSGTIDASEISNANVTSCVFSNGTVSDATVTNSDLGSCRFAAGTMTSSTVDASSLTNGTMDAYVITNTRLSQGTMEATDISGGTMTGTNIVDATFANGSISGSSASGVTMQQSVFSSGTVDSTAFTGGTVAQSALSAVTMTASTADSVSVSNSTIVVSSFSSGTIDSTSITNGNITGSTVSNATITSSTMKDSTVSGGALVDMSGNNVSLRDSSFSGGTIDSASFSNGTITSTTGNGMTIASSSISGSSLSDVAISASNVVNSNVSNSSLVNSNLSNIDVSDGRMVSSSFSQGTVDNSAISSTTFVNGDVTNSYLADDNIVNSTFANGKVLESNVSLESENTLDVSRGTVVFAADQINGDWIAGGEADVDISGNAATVTNGVYRSDFAQDHSMLKADVAGEPTGFPVSEETLVGRRTGSVVQSLDVPTVQDMLDVVQKRLYADNAILKSDVASQPVALTVAENTIVGRQTNDVIESLTPEQVVDMIMTTEILHRYGALLRDGHRTFPDGGLMTGLLYSSMERVALSTGQTSALDLNVESSYVSVNFSRAGGRLAKLTLGRGFADGHRKVIILSRIAEPAILQVYTDFVAPATIDPYVFVFRSAGQTAMLQWDTVLSRWLIVGGSGCDVMTRDELRDPEWMDA